MRFANLHINERTSKACERVTTRRLPLSPVSSRFFFFFALSQFRGPDYPGAWNSLFQTLIWRPEETVQNLKSSVPDYPGELTALTLDIILT